MIVIRGGEVLTPDGWLSADVRIEHGWVTEIGEGLRGGDELDAGGCLVGPAFVDMHTHLREPGQTWKEDIDSASRAAVVGGFGAVVAMPNTDPPIDHPKVVEEVMRRGSDVGLVDVIPSACLTEGRAGAAPSAVPSLYEAGVRVFTDDGDSVRDSELMREVMELVAQHPGALVAQHAEDPAATAGSHLHDGEVARRLGLRGMPAEAESSVVNRDLQLAAATGVRYHCQHVSSRRTLEALGEARRQGARVTSEVTPHHLILDETDLGDLDTNRKMYPPLRSRADRLALVKALRRGMIDVVATDHAPHTSEEKDVPFAEAPRGVIGLETAAAAVWEVLGDADRLFEVLSSTPARLIGLSGQGQPLQTGASANIVVFDPRAGWTVETFASKSANSPFLGREMIGRVRSTIHDGEVVHTRDTRG